MSGRYRNEKKIHADNISIKNTARLSVQSMMYAQNY